MTVWVVCGAARGAGKSWIAGRLLGVLPRAVHVKHGHGEHRPDRDVRLFHDLDQVRAFLAAPPPCEHLVVESNALALEGGGDLVVFVDAPVVPPVRRPDADALKDSAHLVVACDVTEEAWDAPLAARVPDPALRKAVRAILAAQRAHLFAHILRARCKVWLEVDGRHGLGEGLALLLPWVEASGTLAAGAREVGLSYRHAWDLVRQGEAALGFPLVATRAGGRRGGSTTLTPDALRLVALFRKLEQEVEAYAARRLARLLHGEPDG
ncbi:MAG: LysR family transcriptional regulator [Deltaproteobacteria bacterium]|nr:LysR family transcriptional regulator [Deltaproteobacteria bacterium]